MGNAQDKCSCSSKMKIEKGEDFKKGQHIVRPGEYDVFDYIYQHHAIVAEVYTTNPNGDTRVKLIEFGKGSDDTFKIIASEKTLNPRTEKWFHVVYDNPRFSGEEVVSRAESKVYSSGQREESHPFVKYVKDFLASIFIFFDAPPSFNDYDLLLCNCEHFCRWCVTDEMESLQVLEKMFSVPGFLCDFFRSVENLSLAKPIGGLFGSLMQWNAVIDLFEKVAIAMVESCKNGSHIRRVLKTTCFDFICGQILNLYVDALLPQINKVVSNGVIKGVVLVVLFLFVLPVCKKLAQENKETILRFAKAYCKQMVGLYY